MKNLKYLKKNETGFIYFPLKYKIFSAICVVLIILGCVFNFYNSTDDLGSEHAIIYRIMAVLVPFVWLYNASSKVEINTKDNSLIVSNFFGIFKKKFFLNAFSGFLITRKSTYFIYTDTSLAMVFKTKEKSNDVTIASMRNTTKLDALKLEISALINTD